jgi:hypothetical protein
MTHRFTIDLESPRDDSRDKATRRLRAFLKMAWRAFRLKCVGCREHDKTT